MARDRLVPYLMGFQSANEEKLKLPLHNVLSESWDSQGCVWVHGLPSGFLWVETIQVWKNCSSSLNCVPSFSGNCRDNCKVKWREADKNEWGRSLGGILCVLKSYLWCTVPRDGTMCVSEVVYVVLPDSQWMNGCLCSVRPHSSRMRVE